MDVKSPFFQSPPASQTEMNGPALVRQGSVGRCGRARDVRRFSRVCYRELYAGTGDGWPESPAGWPGIWVR